MTPAGSWYQDDADKGKSDLTRLLARLAVSGSIQLFDFEPGLALRLGSVTAKGWAVEQPANVEVAIEVGALPNIKSITTESVYEGSEDLEAEPAYKFDFTVRSNDNLVFEAPSFITTLSYASYIPWEVTRSKSGQQVKVLAG